MSNATFDFDSHNGLGIDASPVGDDSHPLSLESVARHQALLTQSPSIQAKSSAIVGTDAADRLRGTTKADTIDGLGGDDRLLGRNGNDRLLGRGGSDRAKGGQGNDQLKGNGGNDSLLGNDGDDSLVGGGGNDKLKGGTGRDTIKTGKGRDTVILGAGDGTDTIVDFSQGKDTLKLRKGLRFADLTIAASGRNDSAITLTETGEVLAILKGIRPNQLTAADFGEKGAVQSAVIARDDALTVREGRTATQLKGGARSLLANDQGSALTLDTTPVRSPKYGTVQLLLDGQFVYEHDGSEAASDRFRYRVIDQNGNSDVATVRITVNPVNDAPIGVADQTTVSRGGTMTTLDSGASTVLANDTDPEGSSLTAELVEAPLHASNFQFNANGSFTYTHDGSQNLSDRFTYRASDGRKSSNLVTVAIAITPSNGNAPVAVDDQIRVREGGTVSVLANGATRLTANDTDLDLPGDTLKVSLLPVVAPVHGTLQLRGDGTFVYTHDGSENLSDSFIYEVKDSEGNSDTATAFITVDPVNDQPAIATNVALTLAEGGQGAIAAANLQATDIDSPAAELVYTVTGRPTHGRLELTTNPGMAITTFTQADINANRVLYIHNNSNTTSDRFTFEMSDGGKDGTRPVSGTFNVQITPVVDVPVAVTDAVSVGQAGTTTVLVSGASSVLANDTLGESATLTAILVNPPQFGTLTFNDDGTFSYTHDGSENFEDSFTYQVSDGINTSDPVAVAIAITPFNKAPVNIVPGQQTTNPNTSLLFSVGNDNRIQVSDPDAGATPIQVRLRVSAGNLSLSGIAGLTFVQGDGTRDPEMVIRGTIDTINAALDGLSYNPPRGFIGTALLTLTTNDLGNTGTGGALLDTDTIEIIVGSASDINDPPVNTVPGSQTTPQTTELVFQSSNSNAIQISDPDAGSAPVEVRLSVTSGTLSLATLAGLTFLQGDGSNDGAMAFRGTIASINAALEGLRYVPDSTFSGTATLTIRTNDQGNTGLGNPQIDEDQVAITVTRVNQAPIAEDDAIATSQGTPINIPVLSNDSDSDGSLNLASIEIDTLPTGGTLSIDSATGIITYTPNDGFSGTDTFIYTVQDNEGLVSNPATVTITVNPVNDQPDAVEDSVTTDEDTPVEINVLANDTDPDGNDTIDPTTVTVVTNPANGTVSVDPTTGVITYTPNENVFGEDTFTYTVADEDGLVSDPATVTITVNPVNDQPDAVEDSVTTDEDTPIEINVLANDTDPDGNDTLDPTTVTVVTNPTNGTVSVNPTTGAITYTPNENVFGEDTFTYTVADEDGLVSEPATVTITVNPVNDQPDAVEDSVTTDEDTPVEINVLANDTDPDGNDTIDPTTVTVVTNPTNGTVSVNPTTGVITYTPNENVFGEDTFTYTVADEDGLVSEPATVTITVNPVNDQPDAVEDSVTTDEDTPVEINVLANDTDPDGNDTLDPTTVTVVTNPANGTVSVDPTTGVITYTPNENVFGEDTFTYTVADEDGLVSEPATVTITVNPVNDQPDAVEDSVTTDEDTPVEINVLANDTDPDGNDTIDPTTVTVVTNPTNGTVSVDPTTGVITYTPNENVFGEDTFTYTVADEDGLVSEPATVTITVNPVNDLPVAQDDQAETNRNQNVIINVLANDADPDGTLDPASIVIEQQPRNGTVSVNTTTGEITYSPTEGMGGVDTFTYTVQDNEGGVSNTATVTIQVGASPDAVDDAIATDEDTPIEINVLTNDTDPDGNDTIDPTTVTVVTNPTNGTVSVDPTTGVITYTPNENVFGEDTFTYTVADEDGLVSDPATVTITVNPVNDQPDAVEDSVTTDEDTPVEINVLANDTDVDGNDTLDPTTVTVVTNPTNGTVSVNPTTGVITYTPNENVFGEDTFTYTVADEDGLVSEPATVTITVNPVNDQPDAVEDSVTTDEDTPVEINVLANDTDPDGNDTLDPTTVTVVTNPTNGTVSVNPTTGVITYTPNENVFGEDTFTYTVADEDGLVSEPATVTITVNPVNDQPDAVDDTATTEEDTPIEINVLANDTDPDGNDTLDPTTVTVVTNPTNGTVSVNPTTGVITYTPNENVFGEDTFTYTVADEDGLVSEPATVTITVNPANDQPIAQNDSFATSLDVTLNGNLLIDNGNGADADPDDDPLTVTQINGSTFTSGATITLPSGAFLTVNDDGTFAYVSNAVIPEGETATDSFTYTISDGNGGTSTATADITISGSNNSPDARDDAFETDEETAFNGNLFTNNGSGIDADPDGDPFTVTAINGATFSVGQVITLTSGATVTVNADGTFAYDPNGAFNELAQGAIATDSFTYTITDSKGKSDTATVSIQITGINDNPVGAGDTATTNEDTAVTINVLANDTDPDVGDTLRISSIDTTGTQGQIIITDDNRIFYDPRGRFDSLAVDQTATDTFTYNVIDSSGAISTATVTVTILGVNDAPVVRRDSVSTGRDQAVVINVLANDTDIDGTIDPTSIMISANPDPNKGEITINGDGTITYTPKPGVVASDSFTYTVTDNNSQSSTSAAIVDISIVELTGNPVANGDAVTINEGETVNINLIANDIDDGSIDPDSIEIVSNPAYGTLTLNGDGTVTYTPTDPNNTENDGFSYRVRDDNGNLSNTATVTITIEPVNDAPVNTLPTAVNALEDTPFSFTGVNRISVSDVDRDINGVLTSLTVTLSVTSGTLTLGSTSGLTFPNGGDGVDDSTITIRGTQANLNTALNGLIYTPTRNFFGNATLIITTSDRLNENQGGFGSGGPKATTNSLTINVQPDNDAPIARDDLFTTDEDSMLAGNVLLNNGNGRDRDLENDPLSIIEVNGETTAIETPFTLPSGAIVTLNADGTFTYDPNGAFDTLAVGEQGVDTFEYTLSDGNGGTDTATVTITIDGLNDAPIIDTNNGLTVKKEREAVITVSALNEGDPDSDGSDVTYVISASPLDGRLALVTDLNTAITEFTQADLEANRVVYVHTTDSTEPDRFEFFLQDQEGLTSGTETFTINITTLNVAPAIDLDGDDSSGALNGDYIGRFNEGSGGVAIADSDSFIIDGDDTSLVSMTVTLTNRPDGTAEGLSLTGAAAAIATAAGVTTAYDPDTGVLTLTGRASLSQYKALLDGIRYTNTALTDDSDRLITVTLDDGFDTTTATSTVLINRAPTVGDDSYTGGRAAVGNTRFTVGSRIGGTSSPELVVSGSILDNDTDINGDDLSVTPVTNGTTASGGRFTLNANGTFTYLPPVGFTGSDSFTYTVTDEFGAAATGTVTIAVDDLIWYVDSSTGTGGTGYADSPFKTLADAQTVAGTGAYIYVYAGSTLNETTTLEDGQSLIGAGADLIVSNGRNVLAANGTASLFNSDDDGIVVSQNNTIRGLTLGANTFAIRDSGTNVGTLTVSDVTLNSGFRVQSGGNLDVNLSEMFGTQLILQGVSGTFAASNVTLSGGDGATVQLTNNTATINLQEVNISVFDNTAIASTNGGNLTIENGTVTVFQFDTSIDAIRIAQSSDAATVTLTNLVIDANGFSSEISGFGISAESSGTGTLNLDLSGNSITSLAIADIQLTQTGTSIFALKDFVGDGNSAAAVIAYLETRNPGSSANAIPGTNGFTGF